MPWERGQSGNPGGRPKRKLVSDAIRKELQTKGPGSLTHAQEMAWRLVQLAIAGDVAAAKLVLEYTEGKPEQPVRLVQEEVARIARERNLDADRLLALTAEYAARLN